MATIDCPDCHGMVSELAVTCPHCGRPMGASPINNASQPVPVTSVEQAPSHAADSISTGVAVGILKVIGVLLLCGLAAAAIVRGCETYREQERMIPPGY